MQKWKWNWYHDMLINWIESENTLYENCWSIEKKSEIENRYHENCFDDWKVKVKTDIVKHDGQLKSEN